MRGGRMKFMVQHSITTIYNIYGFGWLVVFNVPSTARSFRDGTPIYCPLRRTWSSINIDGYELDIALVFLSTNNPSPSPVS